MKTKIQIILSGTACLVAGALACAVPTIVSAADPNVALENQAPGPAPSTGHVWMAGHWNSENGQWKWVAGHWDLPPSRSAVWIPGHWIQGGNGWVWVNGAWNVAEAPQSAEAPPQPPSPNGNYAPGQGVPAPGSPAPNVAGQYQYAPGTQVPDQAAADTYYPPDYSVAYPGYYWDGAAWAWGFYPGLALGLGWWGPGWGWGHGGYFYGGHGYHGGGYHHGGGFVGHGAAGHAGGGHFR
jgi:hypothetical protein